MASPSLSDRALTVALPKGRLTDDALAYLARAGYPSPEAENGRR